MRYDYLNRYWDDFSAGGFKRLISEGFVYQNAHYNYVPTYTGPGHASVYTGTTPSRHGIIGNNWYDRNQKSNVNCVSDSEARAVGGSEKKGNISSRRMITTTFTDELRLFSNFESKVVSLSIKDRGAALPAGHNPTGAYWYDLESGNMMSSTFFTSELPDWVSDFNKRKLWKAYLNQTWKPVRDTKVYNESITDGNPFEQEPWKGMGSTFPYDYKKVNDSPSALKYSPFAIPFLGEFAKVAVKGENLGLDKITDVLAISISTTDDLGHRFGPRSKEIQDIYLRLDLELTGLFAYLDKEVGENEYTVFLTSRSRRYRYTILPGQQ